jgi:diacylglycerol kinase family enzyme
MGARIQVLWNAAAGRLADRAAGEAIAAALARAGLTADIHPVRGRAVARRVRSAVRRRAGIVVAAGGDGTVSSAAAALAGTRTALAILPTGTRNHFARDLGIPLDLEAAARVVADGVVRRVDIGEVNGRRFVNNSSIGLYPRIVVDRDGQRARLGRGRWLAMAIAVARALRRAPALDVVLEDRGGRVAHRHRTPFVFVGNNEYSARLFAIAGRESLCEGWLGVYLSRRTGRFSLLRLALRAALGRLEQARDFEAHRLPELCIRSHRRRLHVALDGEVLTLRPPLRYVIRPQALRVVVPEEATSACPVGRLAAASRLAPA